MAATPPKSNALFAFSNEGSQKQAGNHLSSVMHRAPKSATRCSCASESCSAAADTQTCRRSPALSPQPRRRHQGNHLEQAFHNLLGNTDGSRKSRCSRLREAALFLFTEGAGKLSSDVAAGKQGCQGPQFATIMVLRRIMETLTLADFGLSPATVLWNYRRCVKEQTASGTSRVAACWNVVNTPEVCIALFLLPEGCPLQMHGHPGMVVVTKVLFGTLHVKIASALSEEVSDEGSRRSGTEFTSSADPGISYVRLNERIADFGATPVPPACPESPIEKESPTTQSSSISSVRRRLLEGSRIRRSKGAPFQAIELFNDMVSVQNDPSVPAPSSPASSDSSTSPDRPQSPSSSLQQASPLSSPDQSIGQLSSTDSSDVSLSSSNPNSASRGRRAGSGVRSASPSGGWADVLPNKEAGFPSTFVCTPALGNLHRFESKTPFVLLVDLISPGYGTPEDRDCQYFEEKAFPSNSNSFLSVGRQQYRKLLLEEIDEALAAPEIFLEMMVQKRNKS